MLSESVLQRNQIAVNTPPMQKQQKEAHYFLQSDEFPHPNLFILSMP